MKTETVTDESTDCSRSVVRIMAYITYTLSRITLKCKLMTSKSVILPDSGMLKNSFLLLSEQIAYLTHITTMTSFAS